MKNTFTKHIQSEDKLQLVKNSIIDKCFDEFFANKNDREALVEFLIEKKIISSVEDFEKILESKEKFISSFQKLSMLDLEAICTNEKIDIDKEKREFIELKNPYKYYKVEFDVDLIPKITPLRDDEIFSSKGLDRSRDFIVCNSGNDGKMSLFGHSILDIDDINKAVTSETKILEKGLRETRGQENLDNSRQYLVTVNEFYNQDNMNLISQHNSKTGDELRTFSTDYAKEQAKSIYRPLIFDEEGKKFSYDQIKENFTKAISFNPSFGSFSTNCQINSLIQIMKDAEIDPETIKQSIQSMSRFDAPNMVKIQSTSDEFPSATAIVFQATNDKLAIEFGAELPSAYSSQRVTQKDNLTIISTPVPEEVYHPAKRIIDEQTKVLRSPNEQEKEREQELHDKIPQLKTLQQISLIGKSPMAENDSPLSKSFFSRIRNRNLEKKIQEDDKIADETREKRREDVKKDENLDGFRYRDPRFHNRPHVVGEPTPGHEVEGRDPSLLYKLMNERLFHRDPKTIIKPDNETVKKLIEKQPRSIKS